MVAVASTPFRIANAKAFLDAFLLTPTYLGIGRTRPWEPTATSPEASDSAPPIPSESDSDLMEFLRGLIGAKRINDISLAIARHDWTSGTVYTQYDSTDPDITTKDMYVVIADSLSASYLNVYKCLDNNGGAASTNMPTGTSLGSIGPMADGYRWKFMFNIDSGDMSKFGTASYLPIKFAPVASLQEAVQLAAINGSIETIIVTDGGTGYTSAPEVTITGDGTGATATATVSSGVVTKITINNAGNNYTYANIVIGGPGTGATARPNIAPGLGHGSNAPIELGAYFMILSCTTNADESGDVSTENDIRSVVIIRNPKDQTNLAFTAASASLTTKLMLDTAVGAFVADEKVTTASGMEGYVVEVGVDYVLMNDVKGPFVEGDAITGDASAATANVISVVKPEFKLNTDQVFYLETMTPVTRSDTQTERYKVVVQW